MATITAKYMCSRITTTADGEGGLFYEAELVPVVGDVDNEGFFSDTPMGTIRLPFLKKEVSDIFVPGATFAVDFTPTA